MTGAWHLAPIVAARYPMELRNDNAQCLSVSSCGELIVVFISTDLFRTTLHTHTRCLPLSLSAKLSTSHRKHGMSFAEHVIRVAQPLFIIVAVCFMSLISVVRRCVAFVVETEEE